MCGRLPVGKSFLEVMHGWSVLPCVRPFDAALSMAAVWGLPVENLAPQTGGKLLATEIGLLKW
jgi:hypothetical protein